MRGVCFNANAVLVVVTERRELDLMEKWSRKLRVNADQMMR
jgi:hypothetical protein